MAKAAPTPANPAIQSDDEAGIEAQECKDLDAQLAQLASQEKAVLAAVTQTYKNLSSPIEDERKKKFARVQAWGEATRQERKTIKLPNGRKLEWRPPSSPRLLILGELIIIARLFLRLDNWEKYVAIELKKNNIKADFADLVKKLRGLNKLLGIDDTEYFRIT